MGEKKYYSTPEVEVDFYIGKDVLTLSGEAGNLGNDVFTTGNEYDNFWW